MPPGSATIVLHTHLPYCRMAGRWPHGEEWLHEAMLECYLPLVRAFRRVASSSQGSIGVTINMTPILVEQLVDPLVKEHFREYLDLRIARATNDVSRFDSDPHRQSVARFHRDRYEAIRRFYEDEIGEDLVGALARLEGDGRIEIATCAATHGYLPLLDDPDAIRFQVETGVASHIRNFGRQPRSFWLPECAYRPGLEDYLAEAGIKVFFVETHLVTGGRARGKAAGDALGPYDEPRVLATPAVDLGPRPGTTFRAYTVGRSEVAVIARNERTGLQVWSAAHGYPGDPAYREFHKKDDQSGLHYWRLTGPDVDLGDKDLYDHAMAARVVRGHASHFHGVVRSELEAYESGSGAPGMVLMAYDTELFGHWWLEGVDWIEATLSSMATDPAIRLTTAGAFVSSEHPSEAIDLPRGSWGNGGDDRTWMNADTAWTWPEIYQRQARAGRLLVRDDDARRQLARELLLLQSSDWQFLMTTRQAHDYAVERFNSHVERFDRLADAIETDAPGLAALVSELQNLDNPFPGVQPTRYGAGAVTGPLVR